ncbi:MAG: tRNA (N6-threonylcarbamoyladenosine(37)-N6)-methyltransferase TrmO, partial [Bacteroidales bacterium]|nr:tRNA (N6-threonylcarbamoyladenosine(37)-N6)-methyltransferase TrmO [Bacteroidales bacterium]
PNGLGLSCVKIESVDPENGVILVSGADLADGTPVYDIKPYVEYADSRPGARNGFVDERPWEPLEVTVPEEIAAAFTPLELSALKQILAADPRPPYQDDPEREYGLTFAGRNVKFRVSGTVVTVIRADVQNEME